MCDRHAFRFDVDKAFQDQLVSALETSPEHPLSAPEARSQPGVYVLFRSGLVVYIGQARNLRRRLGEHLNKVENRQGITVEEVTCRFLTLEKMWEVARAEEALIQRYNPEWNGIPGFSMHVPGAGRPGYAGICQ
jgi:predicted GIY-YIG superfamily endonuclease